MRPIAPTLVMGATVISVTMLVLAVTIASLITIGFYTWGQLQTVASAAVVLDLVSGLVGLGVVISLFAGMFRYARRHPVREQPLE